MSSAITLTSAVRANLLALQNTTANQATTQQRLATGKKVNSALDNPTNFFTAASLSSRAGELTNLLDSMTNGVNIIKAADNGLTSITTTIQSMQATITQARQDASWQSSSYTLDSTTIGTSSLKSISFSGGAVSGSVSGATSATVDGAASDVAARGRSSSTRPASAERTARSSWSASTSRARHAHPRSPARASWAGWLVSSDNTTAARGESE